MTGEAMNATTALRELVEALGGLDWDADSINHDWRDRRFNAALSAARAALLAAPHPDREAALEAMAENARELGLTYDMPPPTQTEGQSRDALDAKRWRTAKKLEDRFSSVAFTTSAEHWDSWIDAATATPQPQEKEKK
jgi:hypothetical protein